MLSKLCLRSGARSTLCYQNSVFVAEHIVLLKTVCYTFVICYNIQYGYRVGCLTFREVIDYERKRRDF